jgi:hypothetical protein
MKTNQFALDSINSMLYIFLLEVQQPGFVPGSIKDEVQVFLFGLRELIAEGDSELLNAIREDLAIELAAGSYLENNRIEEFAASIPVAIETVLSETDEVILQFFLEAIAIATSENMITACAQFEEVMKNGNDC